MILPNPSPSRAPVQRLPLVVFYDSAPCDSKHGHEITIISDGTAAYAYGPITDPIAPVVRDGVTLSMDCGQPVEDDEPCPGRVEVSLDTQGTWTADVDSRRLLAQFGTEVE